MHFFALFVMKSSNIILSATRALCVFCVLCVLKFDPQMSFV